MASNMLIRTNDGLNKRLPLAYVDSSWGLEETFKSKVFIVNQWKMIWYLPLHQALYTTLLVGIKSKLNFVGGNAIRKF